MIATRKNIRRLDTLVLVILIVALIAGGLLLARESLAASKCATVAQCRQDVEWQKQQRRRVEKQLAIRWRPSVVAAVRLASNVSGVSFDRLWTISGCESTHNPLDVLGQYQGLFQLGRYHRSFPDLRGLSPFDPYANAMHAALFIARHGESQWSCRSDGSVAY